MTSLNISKNLLGAKISRIWDVRGKGSTVRSHRSPNDAATIIAINSSLTAAIVIGSVSNWINGGEVNTWGYAPA